MHFRKTKTLYFFLSWLFIISNSKVQAQKDTVYFDSEWSICEKPVAEYYRVTKLQRESVISYSDTVSDFYINGMALMNGRYIDGQKQGDFIFYNPTGKIYKRGLYDNNEMKGIWSYYDSNGVLKAEFNCYSSVDFTPVLIINNAGDTLLKNSNGKFIFNAQKDLPGIFPPSCTYTVEGEVKNGMRDGEFIYSDNFDGKGLKFTEVYKNGEFKRGKDDTYSKGSLTVFKPFGFLNLVDLRFERIDNFDHSNMVFGFGDEGDQKVINFLLNNEIPEFKSQSESYDNNTKDFYNIIGTVIRKYTDIKGAKNISYSYPPNPVTSTLLAFSTTPEHINKLAKIEADATITIDTSGYVVNSSFAGNLPKNEIDEINYYLSRLSGLMYNEQGGERVFSNVTVKISTIIDTVKGNNETNSIYYKCIASNGENTDAASSLNQLSNPVTDKVQIEAKFPGGTAAW